MPADRELVEAISALREEVEALKRIVMQVRLEDLGALVNEILVRRSLLYARNVLREELDRISTLARPDCPHRNACLKAVEEGMEEIVDRLLMGGLGEALRAIEEREMALRGILSSGACPDAFCLRETSRWMSELKDLLEVARRFSELGDVVSERVREGLGDVDPARLARLAEPLSHEARIRILRALKEGPKTFSELEATLGLRSGHLKFHLGKLVRASYVVNLGRRMGYAITKLGADALRALELLYSLHRDYLTLERQVGGGAEGGKHER